MRNDVRELRLAKGISQADLGKVLGVSRQTVNAVETGRYSPSLPLAIKVARLFERAVEEVFHGDDHQSRLGGAGAPGPGRGDAAGRRG